MCMKSKHDRNFTYPDPLCMMCGELCDGRSEERFDGREWELWSYCAKCDVGTFHPRIYVPPPSPRVGVARDGDRDRDGEPSWAERRDAILREVADAQA